jgi:hypothetical protein
MSARVHVFFFPSSSHWGTPDQRSGPDHTVPLTPQSNSQGTGPEWANPYYVLEPEFDGAVYIIQDWFVRAFATRTINGPLWRDVISCHPHSPVRLAPCMLPLNVATSNGRCVGSACSCSNTLQAGECCCCAQGKFTHATDDARNPANRRVRNWVQ